MPKYKKKVVSENVEAELTTWGKQEEFEDTKRAIRIRISKKNRQHNGQKKNNLTTAMFVRCYQLFEKEYAQF